MPIPTRSSVGSYISSTINQQTFTRVPLSQQVSYPEFATSVYSSIPNTHRQYTVGAPRGAGADWALNMVGAFGLSQTNITYRFNGISSNNWTQMSNAPNSIRVVTPYGSESNVGYITGTTSSGFSPSGVHARFDNTSNSWSSLAGLPVNRMASPAAAEENGNVRVVGGANSPYNHYYYTSSTNSFATLTAPSWLANNVVVGDSGASAATVGNKDFIVQTPTGIPSVFFYDVDTATWRLVAGKLVTVNSQPGQWLQYGFAEVNGVTYFALRPNYSGDMQFFAYTKNGTIFLAGRSHNLTQLNGNEFGGTNYGSTEMVTHATNRSIAIYSPR